MSASPRVLFVSPPGADYLALGLLHGLRALLPDGLIDFPKYDHAYRTYPAAARAGVYGRGFTIFFQLEDIDVDRTAIPERIQAGAFDWIVFSDIWNQSELFAAWRPWLSPANTVLLDGADSPQVYPHAGRWWRRPGHRALPRATAGFAYYKREWTEDTQFNLWHRAVPRTWRRRLPHYRGLRETAFSIPAEKIVRELPAKVRDFPRHIVDPEVAARVPGAATRYAFADEAEYYRDLQGSRFGITTKRAGWDCLRHYEIAANGAVPCFRALGTKPPHCAPHGLVPGENCLGYSSADELFAMTARLGPSEWERLAQGALAWVRRQTTVERARALLVQLLPAARAETADRPVPSPA